MNRAPELYTLADVDLLAETDAAIKVGTVDDVFWLPLSQVTKIVRSTQRLSSSVTMTAWIAKQKRLI